MASTSILGTLAIAIFFGRGDRNWTSNLRFWRPHKCFLYRSGMCCNAWYYWLYHLRI